MAGLAALRNGPGLYVVSVKFSYTASYVNYDKKRKKKWDNTDEVFEGSCVIYIIWPQKNKVIREKTRIYILNKTILVWMFRWTQHWLIMNNTRIPIGRNIKWSKTKLRDQHPLTWNGLCCVVVVAVTAADHDDVNELGLFYSFPWDMNRRLLITKLFHLS